MSSKAFEIHQHLHYNKTTLIPWPFTKLPTVPHCPNSPSSASSACLRSWRLSWQHTSPPPLSVWMPAHTPADSTSPPWTLTAARLHWGVLSSAQWWNRTCKDKNNNVAAWLLYIHCLINQLYCLSVQNNTMQLWRMNILCNITNNRSNCSKFFTIEKLAWIFTCSKSSLYALKQCWCYRCNSLTIYTISCAVISGVSLLSSAIN